MITKLNLRRAGQTACGLLFLLALVSGCSRSNSESTQCRILPVGDSITVGYTDNSAWTVPYEFGYRGPLFELCLRAGIFIRYVGDSPEPWDKKWGVPTNQPSPDLRLLDQDHHEGYGGKNTAFVVQNIGSWVKKNKPDFVLLMIGINDIPAGSTNLPAGIEKSFQSIAQTVMDARPATHLIVAQTTPYTKPTPAIVALNRYIRETLVPDFAARGAKISTIDLFSDLVSDPNGSAGDPSLYSNGYNHPNPKGYQRMAQTWFNEIQRLRSSKPAKK
jgi:lysophospholipase L1-like esterase